MHLVPLPKILHNHCFQFLGGGGGGVNKVRYGLCESSENTLTLPNLYCKDDLSQDLGKSIAQECKKSTSG